MSAVALPDVVIISGEKTKSIIRLERHKDGKILVSLAARDEEGVMRIESEFISLKTITELELVMWSGAPIK